MEVTPDAPSSASSTLPGNGLSSVEAAERLQHWGPNSISEVQRSRLRAFLGKLVGPVPYMLMAALALELVLDKLIDGAIIALLLVVNAVLSFSQEQRAQEALGLLRKQLAIFARVRRDGVWAQCAARELVPGDAVHIRMGDVIPADLKLFSGSVLLDASALTGESGGVEVGAGAAAFSGATVLRGEADGLVTATGARSYFGRTAELVRLAGSPSHLQLLVTRIVTYLIALDGLIALAVGIAAYARGQSFAEVGPFALMLLVASVPVALPATFTLATALGASGLAKQGVLVTRLSAIDDAAAMEVLCTDKTRTLTENTLTLVAARARPPFGESDLVRLAALASDN